jgi:Tol biopolymer transport system component
MANGQAGVHTVDALSGDLKSIPGDWANISAVNWMPDSRSFLLSATSMIAQPHQIWHVTVTNGERTRVTADLNEYSDFSVSRDGRMVATVQLEPVSNIFVKRPSAPHFEKQLTTGRAADGIAGLTWTPDGRVVFSTTRAQSEIWGVGMEGDSLRQLLPGLAPTASPAMTPDGRFLLFHRLDERGWRVWRAGADGDGARPLSQGPQDFAPIVGRDGRRVYYTSGSQGMAMSIDGVDTTRIGTRAFAPTDALPDGQLLGIATVRDATGAFKSVLVVMSPDGVIRRQFDDIPLAARSDVLVPFALGPFGTPDGKAITYVDVQQGDANIWSRSLAGDRPSTQLTHFRGEKIFSFSWSRNGDLAVAKGQMLSDVLTLAFK